MRRHEDDSESDRASSAHGMYSRLAPTATKIVRRDDPRVR